MSKRLQHILLIEDDPDIRAIVVLALTSFGGFTLTAVADGAAGVLATSTRTPDLALLDYMMPGMNGIETLSALRAVPGADAHLPAIFLTAAGAAQRLEANTAEGVLGVIAKPFDAVGLAGAIQRLWDAYIESL